MNVENTLCKINKLTKNRLFYISETIKETEDRNSSLLMEVNNRFIGKLYGTLETLLETGIITNDEYTELFEYFMFLYDAEDDNE